MQLKFDFYFKIRGIFNKNNGFINKNKVYIQNNIGDINE